MVGWNFEADYLQACNCEVGCPCNFNGAPTRGNCEALWAFDIQRGAFGGTKLDGVKFAAAAWWPKAIHEGNGVGALYVDTGASPEQRKAVEEIFSGKHGGGHFEVFPKTWTKVHPTRAARITFQAKGLESSVQVEGIGAAASEPIRNPVTGEKFEGQVVLPGGIGWKKADVTRIREFWVRDDDLLMRHAGTAGFVTRVRFTEKGPS